MRKAAPRSRKESGSSGEQGFWPSYTDMMSAVALILFFLMLLAYIQNIITNNDLSHKEEELRDTITKLASVSQQVKDKESELQEASDNLETARKDLDDQQIQLRHTASQKEFHCPVHRLVLPDSPLARILCHLSKPPGSYFPKTRKDSRRHTFIV